MATTKPLGNAGEEELAHTNSAPAQLLRDRIVQETLEIEDDCRASVRCHASAASTWNYAYYLLGLPTAVLAALAGVSAISKHPHWAAGLAIGATISAAANTFLNAGQVANAHAKKRSEYEQLKNEIRHFRNITLEIHRPERELIRELTQHSNTRDVLNLDSPQVSYRAYARVKRKLAEDKLEPKEPPREPPVGASTGVGV